MEEAEAPPPSSGRSLGAASVLSLCRPSSVNEVSAWPPAVWPSRVAPRRLRRSTSHARPTGPSQQAPNTGDKMNLGQPCGDGKGQRLGLRPSVGCAARRAPGSGMAAPAGSVSGHCPPRARERGRWSFCLVVTVWAPRSGGRVSADSRDKQGPGPLQSFTFTANVKIALATDGHLLPARFLPGPGGHNCWEGSHWEGPPCLGEGWPVCPWRPRPCSMTLGPATAQREGLPEHRHVGRRVSLWRERGRPPQTSQPCAHAHPPPAWPTSPQTRTHWRGPAGSTWHRRSAGWSRRPRCRSWRAAAPCSRRWR